jgi:uncharacterized membrane protein YkoI
MTRPRLFAVLLLAAAGLSAMPAAAVAGQEPGREAPQGGNAQIPLSRVLHELAQHHPGKQLNTTMGQAGGRPAYLVQWQLSNGRIVVFTVDAQTGQVLAQ